MRGLTRRRGRAGASFVASAPAAIIILCFGLLIAHGARPCVAQGENLENDENRVIVRGVMRTVDVGALPATFRFYTPGTDNLVYEFSTDENGLYLGEVEAGRYDVEIVSVATIRFENLRALEAIETPGVLENLVRLDNVPVSAVAIPGVRNRLCAVAVEAGDAIAGKFDAALLTLEFGSRVHRVENMYAVSVYACRDWDMEKRSGGKWEELSCEIDPVRYTARVRTGELSAFAVAEKDPNWAVILRIQQLLENTAATAGGAEGREGGKIFGVSPAMFITALMASTVSGLLGLGVYRWERGRARQKRRFMEVISISELPSEGPDSGWIGHLAESRRRAFLNLDDLKTHLMIAGATGSGKTIAAQVIVEEALARGKNVIVFDPTAQWTGFLKKCREKHMLRHYGRFGLSASDARGFPGRIRVIRDPRERINIRELILGGNGAGGPGKITVFVLEGLGPGEMDTFVTCTVHEIFRSQLPETERLRTLIVYDELHRLLPRFGGVGNGVIQIERGVREFRKWGIGLMLVSQVVADFEKEIRANIRTQIQMWTREEDELARITEKFGQEHMQSISKAPVGFGMIVNSDYNRGRPYYVNFRPILHQVTRMSPEELQQYYRADERVRDLEFKISKLEEKGVDTFDLRTELDLSTKNLEEGALDMLEMYLESLEPRVERECRRHGLGGIRREVELISPEEITRAEAAAVRERVVAGGEAPEIIRSYMEVLAPVARKIVHGRGKKIMKPGREKTAKRGRRREAPR